MEKNPKIALSALGIILLLGAGYALYKAQPPATLPDVSHFPPAESIVEHGPYYDIRASYPPSTPFSGSVGAADTALMKTFVENTVAEFKRNGNFDDLTQKDITMMGYDRGRKQTLDVKYLIGTSSSTVSYIFTIYMDTLGAHGNSDFKTFTFDLRSGKDLALADLFLPGSDYLGRISSLSRTALAKNMAPYADQKQIDAGTTPDSDNFKNFFLDGENVTLLFPPYQVGPYAAGPQTVALPRSELADILRSEYR